MLLAAVVVRIPGIDRPLLGPFATKNVVYAMIARNWALGRAPAWLPTLDCLVGGERSLHLVEFPVSAYVTGWLWRVFGGSLDMWGRATSIAFSVTAVALLFLLVRRWHGQRSGVGGQGSGSGPQTAAYAAAAVLAFSPVSITYGQSFMLEASVTCFALAALWSAQCWVDARRWWWLVLAALFLALLLLTKIYMVVLFLPLAAIPLPEYREREPKLAAYRCATARKRSRARSVPATLACAAGLAAALPAAAWYVYVLSATAPGEPLAEHVFYSARQSAEAHGLPSPLLSSAAFYGGIISNLSGVALTPIAFGLALVGLAHRQWRRHALWLASMALLVLLLPRKFDEMNYYYLVILPPLCVLAGLGWERLSQATWFPRWGVAAFVIGGGLISARYTIGPAFITPMEDRAVVAAGQAIGRLTQTDDRVVALHGSSPDLLYYCNRPGWALARTKPHLSLHIEQCQSEGARWLVVIDETDGADCEPALDQFTIVHRGDGFRILGLAGRPPQQGDP